jgi:predicted  nucleic acid-binding Zn-ribbon protein
MHPDLEKLIVLQRHDAALKALRDEMVSLPKHVASLAAHAAAAQAALIGLDESLAKEEKLRRQMEADVRDFQQKIGKVQRQLDQATTTVQVTAFEHEITFLKSEIARLEDVELESMERTEKFEAQRREAAEAVRDSEAALQRERLRTAEILARNEEEVKAHEAQRAEVRAGIGETPLSHYDRIAKAKGTAVAEGVDHKCSVCQMMVRLQKWNELADRDNETMMSCDSCGRLLYYDPARDAPQKKSVENAAPVTSALRAGR